MEVLASSDDGQSVLVECSQREGEKVGGDCLYTPVADLQDAIVK